MQLTVDLKFRILNEFLCKNKESIKSEYSEYRKQYNWIKNSIELKT